MPRPPSNPSLVSPTVPHQTRINWFKARRCVNCGGEGHNVRACTKPKNIAAIDAVFKEVKNNTQLLHSMFYQVDEHEQQDDSKEENRQSLQSINAHSISADNSDNEEKTVTWSNPESEDF
jgi:hypothetical protein